LKCHDNVTFTDLLGRGADMSGVTPTESPEHVALTAANIGGENPSQYGILFA
jgi:hypothetical protein